MKFDAGLVLCSASLSVAAAHASATTDSKSAGDVKPATEEPSESPRYLRDDLATPYFAAAFEMRQLPIGASLQNNIEMHFYTSGHMVYAHEPDLKALHANVAAFIEKTKGGMAEASP
jgi:hypothetical protein